MVEDSNTENSTQAVFLEVFPLEGGIHPLDIFRAIRKSFPGDAFYLQRSKVEDSGAEPFETLIAFDPFETIQVRNGKSELRDSKGTSALEGNPFQVIADRVKKHQLPRNPDLDFFQGGALGYFTYDSVRFLEPVVCRTPGYLRELDALGDRAAVMDAEFIFCRKFLIFNHSKCEVRFSSEKSSDREVVRKIFQAAVKRPPVTRIETSLSELSVETMKSMLGKEKFLDGVRTLKEHIRNGDIFQAVLSEKFTFSYHGNPLNLFETLAEMNPAPYRFFFASGEKSFLGASPEMLVAVHNGKLETHPIAGTRPRGKDAEEEKRLEKQLLGSEKEKAEHLMLVDLARNDIGRVAEPGSVKVEDYLKIRKFGGVMHLVSRVVGRLKGGLDAFDALCACFPAGTLSGAPKIRAMQLLSELEAKPRGFYGGAVVAASFTGDLESCISIRSMEIQKGEVTLQAGAGIVADSQAEREYAEIEHKTRISRRALAKEWK